MKRKFTHMVLTVLAIFTVVHVDAQRIALVGDAADVSGLPASEQNAYNWALGAYGDDAGYLSFSSIAADGLPMEVRAIWFHQEDTTLIAASAAGAAPAIEAFLEQGGGILLSGFATEYVLALNVTEVGPTETISKFPAGPDVAWGVKPLVGYENHPIFMGLTETTDWAEPVWGGFRTISDSVASREAIRWWTGGTFPGEALAVMPWWDATNNEIPVIGELSKGLGSVMIATAPGYDWVSAAENGATEQATLEQLTANMIDYVSPEAYIQLVGEGDFASLPLPESNAYSWAMETYGLFSTYTTFDQVAADGVDDNTTMMWIHLEDTSLIPASAAGAASNIEAYVKGGGKLLVSGFATDYLLTINATDVAPTETLEKDPAGPDAAWGIKPLAGKENHPFFDGIEETTDWAEPVWGGFRTIGDTVVGNEAIRWWNDGSFPGEPIAVMPWWDANNSDIPVVGILSVEEGSAIFASAPGFQWKPAQVNTPDAQANLEAITQNMLEYKAPSEVASILLLGEAASIEELPQGEQNAYNWALSQFAGDALYASFAQADAGNVPETIETIWYHAEDTSELNIPAGFWSDAQDFVNDGGAFVFSGFAASVMDSTFGSGITPITEIIDKDPAGPDAAWGIRPLTGLEGHPVFAGLTETSDWAEPAWGGFRTIGDTIPGREAMAWWNDGSYPGTPIAVMPWWDPTNPQIPTIGEIVVGNGGYITVSAPGYHWKNADINTAEAQANLELLTENIINYAGLLKLQQSLTVLVDGDGRIQEGQEDSVVIGISVANATFVDSLNLANWTVEPLPAGITASLNRIDDQNAQIVLSGTAEDYDEELVLSISIPASEFIDLRAEALSSEGDVVFVGFVEIDPISVRVALLGTESSIDLLDPDEQEAYNWALEKFGEDARYFSFEDVVLNPDSLGLYDVAWFHYDSFVDLPLLADNPNTEATIRQFRENGGGVFLSGSATQYVVNLGVTTAGPNEVIKADEPFTNPDSWGYGLKEPDHPIFLNLSNPFFTLFSENGLREDLRAWWVINPSDDRFTDIPPEDRFDGKYLASTEWDGGFSILVTVAEFEGAEGEGDVIAVGAGAFDWHLEGGSNTLRDNLERFSENIINYLSGEITTPLDESIDTSVPVRAYPNPFENEVNISFALKKAASVSLEIYDIQGRRVAELVNGQRTIGTFIERWKPTSANAGMYFYKLKVGSSTLNGKIVLKK